MKIFKKILSVVVVSCFMLSISNFPAVASYNTMETMEIANGNEEYDYTGDYVSVNVVTSKPKAFKAKKNISKAQVKKKANKNISLINKLLKKKGISKLAKKWLKKAKTTINKILKSKNNNTTKYSLLKKALASIKAVKKAKASDLSLVKQTVIKGSVFSKLKTVLKKNSTYKLYANYTVKIVNAIDKLLKKTTLNTTIKTWLKKAKNLNNTIMFGKQSNTFKKEWLKKALTSINKITKAQGSILSIIKESVVNSAFFPLRGILANDETYKIYTNYATKIIGSIDSLLNNNKIGLLAKTWLKKAKELVNNKMFGKESNLQKEKWLIKALNSINEIEKKQGSIQALVKQSNTDIFSSLSTLISNNSAYKLYAKIISLIKELAGKEDTNDLAKEWLTNADIVVNNVIDSNKSESEKEKLLKEALVSMESISNNNISVLSLSEQTNTGIFSSLSKVLKDDTTYKLYANYVSKCVSMINNLLEQADIKSNKFTSMWLSEALTLINAVIKGTGNDTEKETWLNKALKSITEVTNKNATVEVLDLESSQEGVFSTLRILCQVYKEYAIEGFEVLTRFAQNLKNWGITLNDVYEQFTNFGVTKFQLYKIYKASPFYKDLVQYGHFNEYVFVNCSEVALAAYLGISKGFAALQHVAADIAENPVYQIGDWSLGDLKVVQANGVNAKYYECKLEYFMEGLKEGEGGIMNVSMLNGGSGHAIGVFKESEDTYAVYDIQVNRGEKVIYTSEEFIKLMSGDKNITATGIDANTGNIINKQVYYKAQNNSGEVTILTDSEGVAERKSRILNMIVVLTTTIYDVEYKLEEAKTYMNELLNRQDLKETVRTWLNEIKNSYFYAPKSTDTNFYDRMDTLSTVIKVLQTMSNTNLHITAILNATFPFGTKKELKLTPFTKFLEDDIEYKIYMTYKDKSNGGEESTILINGLSEKLNLSREVIYEQFLELGLTNGDIHGAYRCFEKVKNEEDFVNAFVYGNNHGYSSYFSSNDSSDPQHISAMMIKLMELAGISLAA